MKKLSDLDIAAHRGGAGPYIENSLQSFLYAIKIGFKTIELDVRYSYMSRFFFLEHDFLHHPRFRANRVEKVFPKIPKKINLMVEVKTNSLLSNIYAKAFIKVYDEYLEHRQNYIISYNPIILYRLKRLRPEMKVGYICGSRFFKFAFELLIYPFLKPEMYIISRRILNKRTVRFAKKRGIKTYSYVINRNEDRHKALDLNLDGIITDYPL